MIVRITGGTSPNTIEFTNIETGEKIKGVRSFEIRGAVGTATTIKLEFIAGKGLDVNAECVAR